MVSDEALKKLQEQIAAWPMTQRFVVQQLIEDYRMDREDLRAYEDTRLEPEEITAMRHTLDEYHKVADPLLRAQADGRSVVLPCKVGETVYRLFAGNPDNPVISTLKINTVTEAVKLIGKMGSHNYIGTFLTREEAEKALEAQRND